MPSRKTIHVPDLGSDALEVTAILVSPGDDIEVDQGLVSVEGDKASMDIPSSVAGTLVSILVKTGDPIQTGMPLAEMEVPETATASDVPDAPAAAPEKAASEEPETSQGSAGAQPVSTEAKAVSVVSVAASEINGQVHASPSVRRFAFTLGADLTRVSGTGRKGRVRKIDVEQWVKKTLTSAPQTASMNAGNAGFSVAPMPQIDFSRYGEIETRDLSRIQRVSGPALHRNWVTIPHVTQFDEADITDLEAFRTSLNDATQIKQRGFKITPLVFIMKAVAKSLELHPTMNASLSNDGKQLILKQNIHLGIAVDTPDGLVVPVIRNVEKRTITDLSGELFEVSKKARDGQLTIEQMKGSTFTISSLGGIGGTAFTPIVNAPDVGILGVSRARMSPVWTGATFAPRLMLPLSLSYDHRVIDGAEAARFITTLRGELEDIRKIIL